MIGTHKRMEECIQHECMVYYVFPNHQILLQLYDKMRILYGAYKMERMSRTLIFKPTESSLTACTVKCLVLGHGLIQNMRGFRGVVLWHPAIEELPQTLYDIRSFKIDAKNCNGRHPWLV